MKKIFIDVKELMMNAFHLKEKSKEKLYSPFKASAKKLYAMLERLKKSKRKLRIVDNRICVLISFSIITVIGLVIFRNFIFTDKWPGGGDVLGVISRSYLYAKDFRWLQVWRMYSFGFAEGVNFFDFFLLLIYSVFRDPSTTTKVSLFLFFLAAGFSMYAFAYRYTRKHIAAFSAALIYILNPWFFSQFTEAHGDFIFSYALAPLLFLLLDKALERGKFRDILALSLMFAVFVTSFHPESIVIYGVFLAVFILIYVLKPTKSNNFRMRIKRLFKVLVPVGIVSFLLAAPVILPLLSNLAPPYYSPTYQYYVEETYTGSYQNITDAFTLRALEQWGYAFKVNITTSMGLPDFPTYAFLICLFLVAYCTIFFRRDRYTYFFVISAIISLIIAMGPNSPFGNIFVWAWFNVPHFAVFRAASRWIMMAAFSHSFFVSILVSMMANYLQKKKHVIVTEDFHVRAKVSKELHEYLAPLFSLYKNVHRLLYYLGIILLAVILLTGFFSSFFFFNQGLQVYTPPQNYMEPYEWIAEQPGDYKIVTVNISPSEWFGTPGATTDFGFSGMLTNLGWGHDIGYDSSFIHDKPVLQDGGWSPLSRAFVSFLRFRLASNYMTDDLLKMLGTFDYKYIVLPSYDSANIRNFFLKQQGANIIYNQSGSIIIDNYYYTPHIFASAQHAVIVGGLETFSSLCKIDSFNLDQNPLIFAHQISNSPLFTDNAVNSSEALIFVDTDILDMVMLSLAGDSHACLIHAADYGVPSLNHTKYWTRVSYWGDLGALVLGGNTLTTNGANSVDIPFSVDSDGSYNLWMRVGFSAGRGKLSISIDHTIVGEIRPEWSDWFGLMWVNATHFDIKKGNHVMTLTNDGSGFNDIDTIAIVKPSLLQSRTDELLDALQAFPGRLIQVIEAENIRASSWYQTYAPYNGLALHSEGRGRIVSYEGSASASSVEQEGVEAQRAIDGNPYSRWASSQPCNISNPQWLEIDWATPQELRGVNVVFQEALAKDYKIQTWNDTAWVDQISVEGNTLLERRHDFLQPVNTTKLRIYVTTATTFNMVSIWEFEAYSIETVSASIKFFVPRKGEYMFAARLASGSDYGTFHLKINNNDFMIPCTSSETEFEWREFGPVLLDAGEQTMDIYAFGKVDLDAIIVYSLKNGETTLSLNELFKPDVTPTSIAYEKIDPCRYIAHVNSSKPFLLTFSESYHPLWKAYVNDVATSPIIVYSIVNGFFINKTGAFDIILYFTAQTYADIGLKISLATLILVIIAIAAPSGVAKRIKKYIKRKPTSAYALVRRIMKIIRRKIKRNLRAHGE